MFENPAFWLGAVYVGFPLGLLLYGWNDLSDVNTDSANPRKDSWLFGGRPDAAMCKWLPTVIVLLQIPFLLLFVWISGVKMIVWFAAVVATNAAYNSLGFKRLPVLDILNQAGYVLVFVLASWLCDVPQLNAPAMLFSAVFAMISHTFGQLMDIEPDRLAGRYSTAVAIGARPAKFLLVGMMIGEAYLAWNYFTGWYVAVFMLIGASYFFVDMVWGPEQYPLLFSQGFFIGWNIVVLMTMHWIWQYGVFQLSPTVRL